MFIKDTWFDHAIVYGTAVAIITALVAAARVVAA